MLSSPRRAVCAACFLAVATAALLAPAAGRAQDKPTFNVGVVPQFEARKLADIWLPILDELERRTGYHFDMEGSARIPVFEKSFEAGEFDFAYMNPYHCLVAMETQGYVPLVKDGSRKLFGVLVVRKDSPFEKVEDLAGRTIAFPAPNALGASLLMRAELARKVGIGFEAVYAQTHTSSYLNVVLGEADAAGGVMSTLQKQDPEIRDQLRVIYETVRTSAGARRGARGGASGAAGHGRHARGPGHAGEDPHAPGRARGAGGIRRPGRDGPARVLREVGCRRCRRRRIRRARPARAGTCRGCGPCGAG
jgi:phosphonate transport system substrate-binding protein